MRHAIVHVRVPAPAQFAIGFEGTDELKSRYWPGLMMSAHAGRGEVRGSQGKIGCVSSPLPRSSKELGGMMLPSFSSLNTQTCWRTREGSLSSYSHRVSFFPRSHMEHCMAWLQPYK